MDELPDYSEHHLLTDAAIEAQLDRALDSVAVMGAIARTPFRSQELELRTLHDEVRLAQARAAQYTHDYEISQLQQAITDMTPLAITPARVPERPPARDLPEFAGVMAALAEPPPLLMTDAELIRGAVAVFRSRITRMRELKAARDNPIVGHALNSLELGLMGLERVAGHGGGDGNGRGDGGADRDGAGDSGGRPG